MNKKLLKVAFGFGIFGAGVIFGKEIQKSSHEKKTVYAGVLNLYSTEENGTQMYVALEVKPEDLKNAADVIFKINTLK